MKISQRINKLQRERKYFYIISFAFLSKFLLHFKIFYIYFICISNKKFAFRFIFIHLILQIFDFVYKRRSIRFAYLLFETLLLLLICLFRENIARYTHFKNLPTHLLSYCLQIDWARFMPNNFNKLASLHLSLFILLGFAIHLPHLQIFPLCVFMSLFEKFSIVFDCLKFLVLIVNIILNHFSIHPSWERLSSFCNEKFFRTEICYSLIKLCQYSLLRYFHLWSLRINASISII